MSSGICLVVAYDGTNFHGFQAQHDLRCVQSELKTVLERVCRHEVEVRGASRTDAGVHAEGQIVAFDTTRELAPRRWTQALNRYLSEDIAVTNAWSCDPGYTPRFDARDKVYRYVFHLGAVRDPLLAQRAWHLGRQIPFHYPDRDLLEGSHHQLDVASMKEACALLVGTHDFTAFRAAADTRSDTMRTLLRVELRENHLGRADLMALEIEGTAFMKNMVRIIAGTLIAVGRGRMTLSHLSGLLQPGANRIHAGETAPPQGLTLVSVRLGRLSTSPDLASR